MKKRFALVALALSVLFAPAWAEPNLSVVFVHPEKYTDASYSSSFSNEQDRADVQREIALHLQSLTERALPSGDSLKIEILDIDLAGRVEPFRSRLGSEVRIIREISWPRIALRYTLIHGAQAMPSREEQVSDLNYLSSFNRYPGGDRLRYEKAMLDRWFDERFGKR